MRRQEGGSLLHRSTTWRTCTQALDFKIQIIFLKFLLPEPSFLTVFHTTIITTAEDVANIVYILYMLLTAHLHLLPLCPVSSGKCSASSVCSLACVNVPVLRESTFIQAHNMLDDRSMNKQSAASGCFVLNLIMVCGDLQWLPHFKNI